ncbi:hypothetical protein Bca52824_026851 [Brassica carinata]|uniref:Uncharacterized protein n=1 Tax=Brassica carinata TaxID=52824 RepID=A0A8X7SHA7_BRACI|nr:hypothetical protein Bca52824_026851 [Brassica carinata]
MSELQVQSQSAQNFSPEYPHSQRKPFTGDPTFSSAAPPPATPAPTQNRASISPSLANIVLAWPGWPQARPRIRLGCASGDSRLPLASPSELETTSNCASHLTLTGKRMVSHCRDGH